ncbi:MAG TPA: hypothetical protein VF723_04560, partial [Pyrinomonadaceae bacterium]
MRISVISLAPARVHIEGERASAARAWSFRNTYAGLTGLGERIENFSLKDASGANIAVRRLAPGEYQAAEAATRFSYEMRLEAPLQPTDAAFVSWLAADYGFLMPGDLLPQLGAEPGGANSGAKETAGPAHAALTVQFDLPPGWGIAAAGTAGAAGLYEVDDPENAVFLAGKGLRERRQQAGSMELAYATTGQWA